MPKLFTLQLWLKHLPCPTGGAGDVRTVVFQPGHIFWEYNVDINGYNVNVGDTKLGYFGSNTNLIYTGAYNKWMHLTVIHDKTRGLRMYLNGADLVLSGSYSDTKSLASEPVYLGTSWPASLKRFSGELREFRIWGQVLTLAEMKDNFDRELVVTPRPPSTLMYYNRLDTNDPKPLVSMIISDTVSTSDYGDYNTIPLQEEVGDEDPICCRVGQDCTNLKFNGVSCKST